MKQQTTALLLSALLLSTFATELRMKSRYAPQKKKARNLEADSSTDASVTSAITGTNDNSTCQWVCKSDDDTSPDSRNGNLTVIISGNGSLIAVYDLQSKVAIVFGVDFVAILDGSTGDVAILSTKNETGIFISGGKCNHGWRASEKDFKDYFGSFSLLRFYETYKIGVNATSIDTTEASQFLVRILNILGITIKTSAVAAILEISVSIGKVIASGVLSLFVIKATFTIVAISRDLGIRGLISRLEGLLIIIAKSTEAELKDLNGKLDLRIFLTIRTGADLFVYVYSKISSILVHISFSVFISIVAKFEISEYFRLLLQWVSVLVELIQSGGKNQCIFDKFSRLLILVSLMKTEIRYSFKEYLKNVLSILQRISDLKNLCPDSKCEELKIKGVNVIRIISLLWSSPEVRLFFIVTVLFNLGVLKSDVAINMFFLFLIKLLVSHDDIVLYLSIIPDSNIKHILNSNSSNITVEFSKLISVIFTGLSRGDISILLRSKLKILCEEFNKAVAHVTQNKITFEHIFSSVNLNSWTSKTIDLIVKLGGISGSISGSSGGDGGNSYGGGIGGKDIGNGSNGGVNSGDANKSSEQPGSEDSNHSGDGLGATKDSSKEKSGKVHVNSGVGVGNLVGSKTGGKVGVAAEGTAGLGNGNGIIISTDGNRHSKQAGQKHQIKQDKKIHR